uniref:Macaca fascicularis brain cDNA clone: QtrA-18883, similar to human small protein effector 1 of Cdc42 (SPEC1), mRNA, RefSeq: NM_020239.2 n=1 Tax=Macaca fascicularis TaxID=9541 RepID=I7GF68_MACFA|nr:unnamed protein product [Macaca fascicularis]
MERFCHLENPILFPAQKKCCPYQIPP